MSKINCVICYDPIIMEKEKPLICGHIFHLDCLKKTFKPQCPLCRKEIDIKVEGKYDYTYYIETENNYETHQYFPYENDISEIDTIQTDIEIETQLKILRNFKRKQMLQNDESQSHCDSDCDSEDYENKDDWEYEDI